MANLLEEAKTLLFTEAGLPTSSSSSSQPQAQAQAQEAQVAVGDVSAQRKALLKAVAEGLTRLSDGQEISLNDLIRKLDNVRDIILSLAGRTPAQTPQGSPGE